MERRRVRTSWDKRLGSDLVLTPENPALPAIVISPGEALQLVGELTAFLAPPSEPAEGTERPSCSLDELRARVELHEETLNELTRTGSNRARVAILEEEVSKLMTVLRSFVIVGDDTLNR